jgi:hypothetical protein
VSLLFALLPPINDIVALSNAGIDKELCISIIEEALQHLEELLKTQSKECEACYNSRCFGAKVPSRSLKIGSMLITYLSRICGHNLPLMISIQIFEFGRLINL